MLDSFNDADFEKHLKAIAIFFAKFSTLLVLPSIAAPFIAIMSFDNPYIAMNNIGIINKFILAILPIILSFVATSLWISIKRKKRLLGIFGLAVLFFWIAAMIITSALTQYHCVGVRFCGIAGE